MMWSFERAFFPSIIKYSIDLAMDSNWLGGNPGWFGSLEWILEVPLTVLSWRENKLNSLHFFFLNFFWFLVVWRLNDGNLGLASRFSQTEVIGSNLSWTQFLFELDFCHLLWLVKVDLMQKHMVIGGIWTVDFIRDMFLVRFKSLRCILRPGRRWEWSINSVGGCGGVPMCVAVYWI